MCTAATKRFDKAFEIVFSVVTGQFLARSNVSYGVNVHLGLVFGEDRFTVGTTAMIDIPGSVAATFAINRPVVV